ncbi:acyl-CoA dehydrogenase family protein [uncultured Roseobacter sp.]|uniref:acyl-CoA dehydrogenase family protein n=1 Tax=uncultured Roseobacter sp. TaxID=114847 RepID=UPI002612E236|nr:acyl-CoA dehydrogenase family protein [uncultured Roseobacter sp.]
MRIYPQISLATPGDSFRADLVQTLTDGLSRWKDALNAGWIEDDQQGCFGTGRWQALVDAGLTGLVTSEDFGGMDLAAAELAEVLEHLGYICEDAGLGFSLATHLCSTCVPLKTFGSDALREELLPDLVSASRVGAHAITEAHSGSDAFAMKTTAVRDGDAYVISGDKCFISNAPIADICVIYARTHPTKGALGGFSAFAVDCDSPGFTIGKPRKKMGLRTAPMADLYLSDVRVPASRLIGREGQGFVMLDAVMRWEILCVFAIQVGEMRRQFEACLAYAKERQQFGARIGSFQAVSHRIADMHMRLQSARSWLARMVAALEGGGQASLEFAGAKLAISEAHVANAMDAVTLHGGTGYMSETGIEAQMRNAMGGLIYSGTSDIQKNRIAAILGL